MLIRASILGAILALLPNGIAAAAPEQVVQPFSTPPEIVQSVNALPQLRIDIQLAADELADARMRARAVSDEALLASVQLDEARSEIRKFARNAYLTGTPDSIRIAAESLDGTIGALLHDVALQKYAGSDVALRAVARARTAQHVISGAAIAAYDVGLAEQVLAGRQGLLALASQRLRAFAARVGYPEMMTAALSVDAEGCATRAPDAANPQQVVLAELCRRAIEGVDEHAAAAIRWAFARLGAPYACQGVGRANPLFQFDCSSFVSRAYHDGVGIPLFQGASIPTTATMLAGSGRFAPIDVAELAPGDLVLYDSCPALAEETEEQSAQGAEPFEEPAPCVDRHVGLYLGAWQGKEWMAHTNTCGGVANVDHFWGLGDEPGRVFLGVVRVQRL